VFAQEAGIGVSTLQLWLRQSRSRARSENRQASKRSAAPAVSLLEVELDGPAPGGLGDEVRYEIDLGRGIRLRLPSGFHETEVRRLLGLLKEVT
jgi:hypothetical protein